MARSLFKSGDRLGRFPGMDWHIVPEDKRRIGLYVTLCGFGADEAMGFELRDIGDVDLMRHHDVCGVCEDVAGERVDERPVLQPEPLWSPNPWHR